MKKNDELIVKIDGVTSEGSGVAHVVPSGNDDGRKNTLAVFIAGAAVGDEIRCKIIKVKKNYCIGKIIEIIKPSSVRIKNNCPIFPSCGGCSYRHINFDEENRIKLDEVCQNLKRIGKIDTVPSEIISGERDRYRNKAQYPVRLEENKVKIGFFAQKSHRVIDCEDCLLQPKSFKIICETVKEWIRKSHVSVYDETTGMGLVRHLYIRKAFATGQTMVCLVINGEKIEKSGELVSSLIGCDESIETIVLNKNTDDTNVVLSDKFSVLYGDGYITDELCGNKIRISPLSFYQVNHDMCEKLYSIVSEFAEPKETDVAVDLYCGTGTIGLSIAKKIKTLYGVEIVESAVEDARKNAEINSIENAEFMCADAAKAAKILKDKAIRPNICIVDPPRKGVDSSLPDTIAEMQPEKVIYVSCDSATLARDLAIFEDKGYTAERVKCVNMFPATVHVETVVQLIRKQASGL